MRFLKNKKLWFVVILLLAGGGAAYMYRDSIPGLGGSSKKGAHKHKPGQVMYTCSMHPQVMKSEPGPCPICGMPLTPMKMEDTSEHEGHDMSGMDSKDGKKDHSGHKAKPSELQIKLSSAVIQKMGIITDLAVKKPIQREVRSVAHIDYNETKQVIINSRVEGWIEKLYVRYTGQTVRRGQTLAGIYSPELVSTQQEYLSLYRRFKEMSGGAALKKEQNQLLSASRQRLLYWNISQAQIRHLEKTGKVSRLLSIHSPYSGVVIKKHIKEGEHIKAGQDLFEIADLSTVWAYVHIPEQDIPFVKLGMKADMIVPQYAGKTFPGHVSFIFPFMEKETRDLKIRLSFANPKFHLKPGMFSTVVLKASSPVPQVVIPESAVIRSGTRNLVFVYKGNGIFVPREVRLGVTDGEGHIQILSGVEENEAVATSGQFLFDSETKLQEAVRKMRAAGAKGMPGGHHH